MNEWKRMDMIMSGVEQLFDDGKSNSEQHNSVPVDEESVLLEEQQCRNLRSDKEDIPKAQQVLDQRRLRHLRRAQRWANIGDRS